MNVMKVVVMVFASAVIGLGALADDKKLVDLSSAKKSAEKSSDAKSKPAAKSKLSADVKAAIKEIRAARKDGKLTSAEAKEKIAALRAGNAKKPKQDETAAEIARLKELVAKKLISKQDAEERIKALQQAKQMDYDAKILEIKKALDAGKITEEEAKKRYAAVTLSRQKSDDRSKEMEKQRADMEAAMAEIKKALAAGKISEEEAKKKYDALARALSNAKANASSTPRDKKRVEQEAAIEELQKALDAGKITEEEAKKKYEALTRALSNLKGDAPSHPRDKKRVDQENAIEDIKKALDAGKITEKEAQKKYEALTRALSGLGPAEKPKASGDKKRADQEDAISEIKKALDSGKLTEAEAKKKYEALTREQGKKKSSAQPKEEKPKGKSKSDSSKK